MASISAPPLASVQPSQALPVRTSARKGPRKPVILPSGQPSLSAADLADLIASVRKHLRDYRIYARARSSYRSFGPGTDHAGSDFSKKIIREWEAAVDPGPFPGASWRRIIEQPDETAILQAFAADGPFDGAIGALVCPAHCCHVQGFGRASLGMDAYVDDFAPQMAEVWETLVKRVIASVEAEGLENSPLMDMVLLRRDWALIRFTPSGGMPAGVTPQSLPLLPGVQVPSFPRSGSALASDSSRSPLERALAFRSGPWRRMTLSSSAALADPASLLYCLSALDPQNLSDLVANPSLSPSVIDTLHEWVIYHLGDEITTSMFVAMVSLLHTSGHPLTEAHRRRVFTLLHFSSSPALRRNVTLVPSFMEDGEITDFLMGSTDTTTQVILASAVKGVRWVAVIEKLLKPAKGVSSGRADTIRADALKCIESVSADQLSGLTRSSILFLLESPHEEVRRASLRLMTLLPSGAAPDIPVFRKARRAR